MAESYMLNFCGKLLNVKKRTHLMGILNCTTDSFYNGSHNSTAKSAIEFGLSMAQNGADFIDIGGESTRPGAEVVPEEEELRRILPVVKELAQNTDLPISVDTYKANVARRALEAGAHMINDISALQLDPQMASVVAEFSVPVILMHIQGQPKDMQKNPTYQNVMDELCEYFEERIEYALSNGVENKNIIIDPGIGFGKRLQDNYQILKELYTLQKFGRPILVGLSRKSFIGKVLHLPPEESLEGSIAASTVAILNGADILRVHDVKEMKKAITISDYLASKLNSIN